MQIYHGCDLLVDDKTANEFATYMKKFPNLYIDLTSLVKHHTTTSRPCILDLGCGPGLLSAEILRQIPDATVIGIDPLIKMLQLAKENTQVSGTQIFQPLQGVSERIPLKDRCIDTIVSRFSLPYWKQPQESFSEMNRILRPKGRIIFEALNRQFPRWKLFGIKVGMHLNQAGHDVIRYHMDAYPLAHTQEEVEMFFQSSGFAIVEKEGKKNEWKFVIIAEKK